MTRIKLTQDAGGNTAGTELDVTTGAAQHLIDNGYAEAIQETKPAATRGAKKASPEGVGGDSPAQNPTTAG